MKHRLFLLSALFLPLALRAEPVAPAPAPAVEKPAAKEEEKKEEYIRVQETDGKATALQTAVVRLTKGKATVELVGAIHIADKKYYQALGKRFEGYQALLWEGIGGSDAAAKQAAAAKEAAAKTGEEEGVADAGEAKKKEGRLNGLHQAYETAAKYLDLAYQMKEIDYSKANFVHADLSMEEFGSLQDQRGESLFSFMLKAGLQAEKTNAGKEPNSFKLLASLIRGDKTGIKRQLVHTLGAGDDQVAALAGESVIISDRNAKCLEVLDREVKAGKTKLGIFYGAAHFPDMVKRLTEQGWTLGGTEWMTAWELAN
ncbi:hypothetical protein [Haloferula sp. BvORR071]|uniref:hypothetical protein n=1 Tax=Haloferula sp. BvORR071 TaxID=1396141 RepID=UPI0005582706|nr:hypothetical protein [Haloferula sp. BvORR071]